jgi:hypothetical protein
MRNQGNPIIDSIATLKRQVVNGWTPNSRQRGAFASGLNRLRPATLIVSIGALGSHSTQTLAMAGPIGSKVGSEHVAEVRDGQHDLDFRFGVWHTHLRRVLDPFSSSSESLVLEGTITVRKSWGGKAQLEEIEADGPKGHWEGLTLYLYNSQALQRSHSFINSRVGALDAPLIGPSHDGLVELLGQDTFSGKTILARRAWSEIKVNSHQESYSNDGGRTWKATLIGDLTRDERVKKQDGLAIAEPEHTDPITPEQHQFDFDFGTWATHSKRLSHPLIGSRD